MERGMKTTIRTDKNAGSGHPLDGGTSEADILDRILEPEKSSFSHETAHDILALDFNQADKDLMRELSAKAREGTLTDAEQVAINNYERVGHLINILQSKARRSLKGRSRATGKGTDH
jgi:hypothetical protein